MLKTLSIRGRDFSRMNVRGEAFGLLWWPSNLRADFGSGRQRRVAQPLMADHAVFSRVGDCSRLQLAHRAKRLLDLRPHFVEEIVRELHAADIEAEGRLLVAQKIFLEPLPERRGSHDEFRKTK